MFTQKKKFIDISIVVVLIISVILTSVFPKGYAVVADSHSEAALQNIVPSVQIGEVSPDANPDLAPAIEVEKSADIPDTEYEKAGSDFDVSVVTEGAVDVLPKSEETEAVSMQGIAKEDLSELDVIELGETYTVFQKPDGTRVLNSFTGDIRYRDKQDRIHDYDHSLVPIAKTDKASEKGKYAFRNGRGDVSVLFPPSLEAGEAIKVANDRGRKVLEMQPLTEKQADELSELAEKQANVGGESPAPTDVGSTIADIPGTPEHILSGGIPSNEETLIVKKENINLYGNKEEQKSSIIYPGEESGVSYEYMPAEGGVKENIILSQVPVSNAFSFYVKQEGTYATVSAVGSIHFIDEKTDAEVGTIMAPYMLDASSEGAYNDENLRYSIEKIEEENGAYIVTLTVDRTYLDDENRKYPVVIDPSYSYSGSSMTESRVQDVYIISASTYDDINFWDSGIRKMIVGYHQTEHVRRTLIKFPDLQSLISKNYVTKATLKLKEISNSSPYSDVYTYRNTESYAASTVTWATRPSYSTTDYGHQKNTGSGSHTFNILTLAQGWADGNYANYGITLRASAESSSSYNYDSYYNARATDTSDRPQIVVEYTVPTPKPPAIPTVTASKTHLKANESFTLSWTGLTSNLLDQVQYCAIPYTMTGPQSDNTYTHAFSSGNTPYKAFASAPFLTTAQSGSASINASAWPDNCYWVCVKGVDKCGNASPGNAPAAVAIHKDSTLPMIASASLSSGAAWVNTFPTMSWSGFADKHAARVEYSLDGAAYISTGSKMASGSIAIPKPANATSGTHTVNVRGVDEMGNVSAVKSLTFKYDATAPVTGDVLVAYSAGTTYGKWASDTDPLITLAGASDAHSGINTVSIQYALVSAGGAVGIFKTPNAISSSGIDISFRLKPEDQTRPSGDYDIYVKVSDNAGNSVTKRGSMSLHTTPMQVTIAAIHDDGDLVKANGVYTGDISISLDNKTPRVPFTSGRLFVTNSAGTEVKEIDRSVSWTDNRASFTFDTTSLVDGAYFIKFTGVDQLGIAYDVSMPIKIDNRVPFPEIFTFKDGYGTTKQPVLFYDWGKGGVPRDFVRIKYRTDEESTWHVIPGATKGALSLEKAIPLAITTEGRHTVYFNVVGATNLSTPNENIQSTAYTYYTTLPQEVVNANANAYRPENISAGTAVNYKQTITWDAAGSGALPANASYSVYKSKYPDFIADEYTLIAEGIKSGHYTDIEANDTAAYYKVRAVVTGSAIGYSSSASITAPYAVSRAAIFGYTGSGENRAYTDFSMSNGSVSIDEASGDVGYTKGDISLSGAVFTPSVERTYNSAAEITTEFGKNMDFSLNWSLMMLSGTDASKPHVRVLKDGSGRLQYFDKKIGNGVYRQKIKSDQVITEQAIMLTLEYTSGQAILTQSAITGSTAATGSGRGVSVAAEPEPETDGFEYIAMTGKTTAASIYTVGSGTDSTMYFDASGAILAMRDSGGNFIAFIRNGSTGLLERVVNNSREELMFVYDTSGTHINLIGMKDGSNVRYTYDSAGRMTKQSHYPAAGASGTPIETSYAYTDGLLSKLTDAEGNEYSIGYEGGKATQATYPSGEKMQLEYSAAGTDVTKLTPAGGVISTEHSTFTNNGLITSRTEPNGRVTTYAYEGDLLSKTVTQSQPVTLEDNVITAQSDPQTFVSMTTYDKNGNPTKETDAETNEKTTYEYNAKGEVTKEITESGEGAGKIISTTEYTYVDIPSGTALNMAHRKVTSVTTIKYADPSVPDSKETSVETSDIYDNTVTETAIDEDGIRTKSESVYDKNANELSSKSSTGAISSIITKTAQTYDVMNRIKTETSIEVNGTTETTKSVTTHNYDGFGRETSTSTTYPSMAGAATVTSSSTYNKNGSVLTSTDRKGVTTSNTYDEMNKVVSTSVLRDEESATTSTSESYETIALLTRHGVAVVPNAHKTTSTSSDGTQSVSYSDNMGHGVRSIGGGIVTDTEYSLDGKQVCSISYPVGSNITSGIPGDADVTAYAYDAHGNNTVTVVNPAISVGGVISVGSASILTTSEYDEQGNMVKQTDALGNSTLYEYKGDKLSKVTLPPAASGVQPAVTVFENTTGEAVTIDANGRISATKSNDKGQTVSVGDYGASRTDASQIVTSYQYSATGKLTRETYQNGNYTVYGYDGKDRTVSRKSYTQAGALKLETQSGYDADDNLVETTDKKDGAVIRHTRYEYDAYGRMTAFAESNTLMSGGIPNESKYTYRYDKSDRVTEIDYPAQSGEDLKGVKYYYDTEGRVSEVKAVMQGILSESEQTLREYTYDAKGRISRIDEHYDFKDALFTSDYEKREYSYDALGRVTLIKYADSKAPATVLESYAYTYDKAGQILTEKIINNRPSAAADRTNQTRTFTYDKVGRLTSIKFTGTSPGSVPAPAAKSYTYDSVGNRLTETAGSAVTNYAYNEFNQLTSRTGANPGTLTYDANGNELTDTASGKTTANEYDVLNRLTKATVTASGQSTVTEATYNGNGQRIKKSVMKSGVVTDTANYFYQDGAVGYTKDAAGNKTTHNIYAPGGGVIASERYDGNHAGFYTYTKDAQGSTMNLLDSTGAFAKGYYYDDFGQTSEYGNASLTNEIAYTGGIYDESTGEYYLNARYYDPADGRFLTLDTYRGEQTDPSSLHLYAYCANKPVNFVDPSGHKYSISSAIEYATKYARNPNTPRFPYYGGVGGSGDCANFASQIRYWGGETMVFAKNDNKKSGWWLKRYKHTSHRFPYVYYTYSNSHSWSVADNFVKYFKYRYITSSFRNFSMQVKKGEFIAFDEEGDGKWNHIGFVTDTSNKEYYYNDNKGKRKYRDFKVAQHTNDYHAWVSSPENGWEKLYKDYPDVQYAILR